MKKFNIVFWSVIVVYLLLAISIWFKHQNSTAFHENSYQVEVNRILDGLTKVNTFVKPDLHTYKFIKDVSYIGAEEQEKYELDQFYKKKNGMEILIRPFYMKEMLKGYVRFDYIKQAKQNDLFYMAQVSLGIIALFALGICFYLKYTILKPFQVLQNMPYEIAKGHLKGELKENQGHYFGKFIWGINMLKDHLEICRKRELRLEKEKKMILLSVSHDIKTPVNAIKLYSKALQENIYDNKEERKNAVKQIEDRAKEIEHFIKTLTLSFSENIIDIQVENGEFYLRQLMQILQKNYGERCAIQNITFKIEDFDNRLLQGDINRTVEACENILENAIKYGNGKEIRIYTYEEDYCQLICFQNTGDILSARDFVHLYDSFYRGENAEGKEGSGLGLYICKEIMKKMDGDIFARKWEDGMELILVFR